MGEISVFIYVSIDGFYAGPNGEVDWFKTIRKDDEYERYTHQQAKPENTLLLGHTTYDMMKSYWPTPDAIKSDPEMAKVMNYNPKIVFSKTLQKTEEGPNWKNIRLFRNIQREDLLRLKQEEQITTLGSGRIVQQLTNLGLVDRYNLVTVPVVLGGGKRLFDDVKKMNLKLAEVKSFKNGIVWLQYQQAV